MVVGHTHLGCCVGLCQCQWQLSSCGCVCGGNSIVCVFSLPYRCVLLLCQSGCHASSLVCVCLCVQTTSYAIGPPSRVCPARSMMVMPTLLCPLTRLRRVSPGVACCWGCLCDSCGEFAMLGGSCATHEVGTLSLSDYAGLIG